MTLATSPPILQQERAEKLQIAEVSLLYQRDINEEAGYVHEVQRID
jgi:hypothetical protein